MAPGDTYEFDGYTFRFDGISQQRGPNYLSDTGSITVLRGTRQHTVLNPEKRIYLVQQMPMTEASIDAGLRRDLYVALGEPLDDQGNWAVRLYVKPYIRWIWLGALIMVFGGLLSATDKRYRRLSRATAASPAIGSSHAAS